MIEAITMSVTTVWLVVAILAVLLLFASHWDSLAASFWLLVIGLAILQVVTIANPLGWVKAHPYTVLAIAGAYLPVGVGWSIFRWRNVLAKAADLLRAEKASWRPSAYATWNDYVRSSLPSATRNKSRIVGWIGYWPFSMADYLFFDMLYDIHR